MTVASLPRSRPDLDGLPVYSSVKPGSAPVRVRASSNEAAGPAPDELVDAVAAAVRAGARYPLIGGQNLIERLASELGVADDQVAVGDGSLTLLDRLLIAFCAPGDQVVMAWRSYEAYPLSVRIAGAWPVLVPLRRGFHDLGAMAEAVGRRTKAVILCNPNNPTGTVVPFDEIRDFLFRVPSDVLVILDEAYIDFADDRSSSDSIAALADFPNLVVTRTFSKAHALAGMRVGYLASSPAIVAAVRAVLPPFPVSAPAVAAALTSLDHPDWLSDRVASTRAERTRLADRLNLAGLPHLPSQANFLWLPLADDSLAFAALCLDHGVMVRPFEDEGVRITVGEPELIEALEPVLAAWSCVNPS